ncbi:hypothetical protein CBR_g12039 [Chara braunii]|uniref:Uncharacterized protein n=1 Tax=Chara braunii TaxID=69332 RepID=A0A388KQX6_CHABU|nr:hypothetical protein CBR_g12039 [Chara braunii]|eukprot:GBG72465.1 hypothetical protein CBR_g12039 [Chara braunii]
MICSMLSLVSNRSHSSHLTYGVGASASEEVEVAGWTIVEMVRGADCGCVEDRLRQEEEGDGSGMWARTSLSKGIWDKVDTARRIAVAVAAIVVESRDEVATIVVDLRDEVVDAARRGVLVVAGSVADSRDGIVDVVGRVDVEGLGFVVVVAVAVVDVEALIIVVVDVVRRVALVVAGSVADSRDKIVDVAASDDVEALVFVVDVAVVVADGKALVFEVVAKEVATRVDIVAIVVFVVVVASIGVDLEDELVEDDSLDDAFGFLSGGLSSWAPARQEQMESEESRGKARSREKTEAGQTG